MEEIKVTNNRFRLDYHLMAKAGWINDPNGFSYFKGYYHMFYQYYPYDSEWGPMHWGHARSKDMIHWETLPIALFPDEKDDGCFSGSAVVYDNKLWLIYTGHHYIDEKKDLFYEDQNLAFSKDGIHFEKYAGNPVLKGPTDNTKHFRDPKVWQENDEFYMVLGSQGDDELGRALLYQSQDLKEWRRVSILAKAKNLKDEGYMWECPDFFRINGQDILLMSPQGLEARGELYRNLNQTGYLLGQLNRKTYELKRGSFEEIDKGHDFYATQTTLTPDGRRVMVAWMNAWDSPMYEKEDGWAGALTIPRELIVKDGKLYQQPVGEMASLRQERIVKEEASGNYQLSRATEFSLETMALGQLFKLSDGEHTLTITREDEKLVLERNTKDGQRSAHITDPVTKLQVFVDASSVEIFVNDGQVTFTERMYWQEAPTLTVQAGSQLEIYRLEENVNRYWFGEIRLWKKRKVYRIHFI